jgi:iron complex transport system substrate-binding protein
VIRRLLALLPALLWGLPAAQAGSGVAAVDFHGREVVLSQPARRIVALAPHIAENVFSAGAGGALVGTVDYSDYPEAAKAVPRVGGAGSWSVEGIVALRPDLVLLWGSGGGSAREDALRRLGLPVFVSELRRLEDIPRSIRAIGTLAGTAPVAAGEAGRIEQRLAALAARYRAGPQLSVFYQIWDDPLQTVNGDHMISQVIELCGGRNVFADARALAPRVSREAVLQRDPEVIVASGMGTARPEWLERWREWPALRAVRANALLLVPPDLIQRPTARILLGAETLCRQLQPLRPAAEAQLLPETPP